MVDIKERLKEIKAMVDRGDYFTINRARQYGKTTVLRALCRFLEADYLVISMDFQKEMSDAKFRSENAFSVAFARAFLMKINDLRSTLPENAQSAVEHLRAAVNDSRAELELVELFQYLSAFCRYAPKPVVLMIDEVDSATNNQVFLDFLAQLRGYYIDRDESPTFQSVILAGVYDVKNIKRKIRTEDAHKVNSPWNTREGNEENGSLLTFDECPRDHKELAPYDIAVDFLVDMSFSAKEIAGMLEEYERDYKTGMDIERIAELIYDYTSGYPFLVSRICKLMDERIAGSENFPDKKSAWTKGGFLEAVNLLLWEKNTLFESLSGKIEDYPELTQILNALLFQGQNIIYSPDNAGIDIALMFGFVKIENGAVVVANRIFEMRLYNMFLTAPREQNTDTYRFALQNKNQFIQNGRLNMELVLEKFVTHFHDLYGEQSETFLEEDGRKYFLLYLRPIINGTGNYYIEARTRNMERTDVVVDYRGEQFVIELKVWRGNSYHTRGEQQLISYLEYYHLQKGYMLSFNFNKKKKIGVNRIVLGDKLLVEAVV